MKLLLKENKILLIIVYFILSCIVGGSILYMFFGHKLIEAMYKGESIEFLNKIIIGQARRPLEHYTKTTDRIFFYFLSLAVLLALAIVFFAFVIHYLKTRKNRLLADISLICVSLIVLFLVMEMIVRTYYLFRGGHKFYMLVESFYDPELGWKGKKIFGDAESEKYKIFFIGDSFTDGCVIDKEDMYYSVIKDNFDAEIFVYGGGGYGTLQEYIVLDKYFDDIKPDLVILQVCDNDFVNNAWSLESRSFYNNHLMMRPYLRDGKVEYRFPRDLGGLRVFFSYHSQLFYLLFNRIDKILALLAKKGLLHSVEEDISEKVLDFTPFRKSVITTNRIVAKIKNRVGTTLIIAFGVDNTQPYFEQFKRIFKENDIEFIIDVPEIISQEEAKGVKLRLEPPSPFAGHFNVIGNKICGQILTEELKELKVIRCGHE